MNRDGIHVNPPACLIAKFKAMPGVWVCMLGHLHLDMKTVMDFFGMMDTEENRTMIRESVDRFAREHQTETVDCIIEPLDPTLN